MAALPDFAGFSASPWISKRNFALRVSVFIILIFVLHFAPYFSFVQIYMFLRSSISTLSFSFSDRRFQGSKFEVQGSKFNVQGSKFNVQGFCLLHLPLCRSLCRIV